VRIHLKCSTQAVQLVYELQAVPPVRAWTGQDPEYTHVAPSWLYYGTQPMKLTRVASPLVTIG
jgi:hypothetical protein